MRPRGLYSQPMKPAIAEPIHRREYCRIIDLALVGLAAGRHRRDLGMPDDRQIFLEAPDQIAADDLDVVEIELHAHVRRADLADEVGGVFDVAEEITRPVARIDRLDQERDVRLGRRRRGARQVGDENLLRRRPLFDRHHAGHAMDGASADGDDVIQRAGERGGEIALAPGQRGETEFGALRGIDAELGELVPRQFGLHRARRRVIGKLQLDRGKARRGRRGKAIEQRSLGEQMAEIGGKARHRVSLLRRKPYSVSPRAGRGQAKPLCILPRENGGGAARSAAVGARASTILLRRQRSVEVRRPSSSSPVKTGEVPRDPPSLALRATAGLSPPKRGARRRKRGGRGAGLDNSLATKATRRVRRPLHHPTLASELRVVPLPRYRGGG